MIKTLRIILSSHNLPYESNNFNLNHHGEKTYMHGKFPPISTVGGTKIGPQQ